MNAPKLVLPTEATPASHVYAEQKFILAGPAGCGKSEFLAQDPNNFFIDSEANIKHFTVKRLSCQSWADLQTIYALLTAERNGAPFPYTGVCIDTFDRILLYASEEVIRLARLRYPKHADEINTIPDIGDGKMGWYDLCRLISLFLRHFENLPCAKFLVCHVKDIQVSTPTKSTFTRYVMNVGGQTGDVVWAWANHILHVRPVGGGEFFGVDTPFVVHTVPTLDIQAKSHGMHVPNRMEWQLTADRTRLDASKNWSQFRALFT